MVNPLLLLAVAAGGAYLYMKSKDAPAKPGEPGSVDLTGGWKPIAAKKPLTPALLATYDKPGIAVKFYLDHVHPSGTGIAGVPEAMANGEVLSTEVGSDGKRYWKVKLLLVEDAATYGAKPASLALPSVGAVFALTDANISG